MGMFARPAHVVAKNRQVTSIKEATAQSKSEYLIRARANRKKGEALVGAALARGTPEDTFTALDGRQQEGLCPSRARRFLGNE